MKSPENDPEKILASEQSKKHFKDLVEQLADIGKISSTGLSQSHTYEVPDGREMMVRRKMSIVNREDLDKLEQLLHDSGELALVRLRRRFPSGDMEEEQYRLDSDLRMEREYDLISRPTRKPISEMTEEELDQFEKEIHDMSTTDTEDLGKSLDEGFQANKIARELGLKAMTEAEMQKINSLLEYVLSDSKRKS